MNQIYGPSGAIADQSPETLSMSVTRRLNELSDVLSRIEGSADVICGHGGGETKPGGPAAVPNGLHAQWADSIGVILARAERVANTLSNV